MTQKTQNKETDIKLTTRHLNTYFVKMKIKSLIMIMINTSLLQNLIAENFTARSRQANLVTKNDIANFVNETDFGNKQIKFKLKN